MSRSIRLRTPATLAAALLATLPLACLVPVPGTPPATPTGSLERDGSGRPACGLGREFHAGRRAALRERVGSGLMLFRGMPETRGYVRFNQDKVFWYLTGVESPGAALLMDAATGDEIMFLEERDERGERWEGEKWDARDGWVRSLTGIADVRPVGELAATLRERLAPDGVVWISAHPHVEQAGCFDRATPADRRRREDPLDGRVSREQALEDALTRDFGARVLHVDEHLDALRRVKTPEELDAMRRAGRSGALAMAEAIRSTRPGLGEWDLEGLMSFIQIHTGASGPAYHAIVGAGDHSNVLHYSASSRRLRSGEILLIDYGSEVDHYTTDITRTWPVDGEFTPRMAELYDAVLAAQEAGIAAVRPGVKMSDIDRVCNAVVEERGLLHLRLHGPCHYIGMEVHDVGPGDARFEPGVAITVEPGLYDLEAGIGVRIEDVVIVTADGCEVITADVPKRREELEALIREQGVFDRLPALDLRN